MVDVALGALLVVLAVRGWMRGLVREVISLAVLVVGTIVSFRLSTPLGRVFADMSGASPDASRVVAGVGIFLLISIGAAVLSRVLHLGIRLLPGVSTANRAAGAALSIVALVLVVTLVLSLLTVMPLPEAVAEGLEDSAVADTLTQPDGVPQQVLGVLSGDRVVEITLRIRELTGNTQAVPTAGQPVVVPATAAADLDRLSDAEDETFRLLNAERVANDAEPVLRSPGLDQLAFDLAMEGYGTGTVRLYGDAELRDRLNQAGIPTIARTELVVLAASPETGHAALVESAGPDMTRQEVTKAGIVVLQGPHGLLVVTVLAA
ncbi:MAG: CvpA family protein [Acidimicrobiia bacterium]|nr:CvpA family protein [Acidimicrobiia bacterium]